MRSLAALIAAAMLVPAVARAERGEWEEDYSGGWSDDRPGYDVSVDLSSGGATFDSFESPLASYGDWVAAGNYGRVWRPRVAAGWRPYYYGRWEWTNEGWLWVSDEPYGWAVYHYGRWAHDPYYGWVWVPGYEWAPAWVSWRMSGDAVGWAPLGPGLSVYVSTYPFVDFWWTFVPTARFCSVPVYSVAYAPAYTRQWYQRTAPAPARPAPAPGVRPAMGSALAWGGPAPRLISERSGRPLTPARIVPSPAPGAQARPGEIPVFRPGPAGRGRGPDAVRAPGWGGDRGAPAPGRPDVVRGPGAAPGWNGGNRAPAPNSGWSGGDRGDWRGGRPGPAAPPAWNQGARQAAPPPAARPQVGREAAPVAPGQGRPQAAPAPQQRNESHGGGGRGGGGGGGEHRGGERGSPHWR